MKKDWHDKLNEQMASQPQECKCACHALGEHYPCHNPNCHSGQKQEEKDWEEEMPLYLTSAGDRRRTIYFIKDLLEKQRQEILTLAEKYQEGYSGKELVDILKYELIGKE